MNGIHDLGGMHGFGPVDYDPDETGFHDAWERTLAGINLAALGSNLYNIDEFRHGIERMDPAHYMNSSYFEHWLDGISRVLIEKGVINAQELDTRAAYFDDHPDDTAAQGVPGDLPTPLNLPHDRNYDFRREVKDPPRFAPGDPVLTRNTHPTDHTRIPRYARGKRGVIHLHHGGFVYPDTNARGEGEQPEHAYSVRFDAGALWANSADPTSAVYVDMWDSYLEPG